MSLFTGVVLLGVVLAALTIGIWWKKTNVVEMLAFGVIYWLCAWVVTAMGFLCWMCFLCCPVPSERWYWNWQWALRH
ncbi:MAG: hypothetical protein ACLUOF_04450 [Ruminococcus sp.]